MLGIVDTREGAIWSAIIGFAAFTGFFVAFVPLTASIGLLYKGGVYLSIRLFFSSGGAIMVLIMAYFMVGMLIALFNASTKLWFSLPFLTGMDTKEGLSPNAAIFNLESLCSFMLNLSVSTLHL